MGNDPGWIHTVQPGAYPRRSKAYKKQLGAGLDTPTRAEQVRRALRQAAQIHQLSVAFRGTMRFD